MELLRHCLRHEDKRICLSCCLARRRLLLLLRLRLKEELLANCGLDSLCYFPCLALGAVQAMLAHSERNLLLAACHWLRSVRKSSDQMLLFSAPLHAAWQAQKLRKLLFRLFGWLSSRAAFVYFQRIFVALVSSTLA